MARYVSLMPIGISGTSSSTSPHQKSADQELLDRPEGDRRGEPDIGTYALHTSVGHHGVFSLTPMWLLTVAGLGMWLARRDRRMLALGISLLSLVVYAFYHHRAPRGSALMAA